MKKNFGKKLISLFFAVLMLVSVIPAGTITEARLHLRQDLRRPLKADGMLATIEITVGNMRNVELTKLLDKQ